MTIYNFQLSYSISPYGTSNEKDRKAAEARKIIKEIEGWESVNNIETTLVGTIDLYGTSREDKRNKGLNEVKGEIEALFERENVLDFTHSHFSLMIDGLGEHITFSM